MGPGDDMNAGRGETLTRENKIRGGLLPVELKSSFLHIFIWVLDRPGREKFARFGDRSPR